MLDQIYQVPKLGHYIYLQLLLSLILCHKNHDIFFIVKYTAKLFKIGYFTDLIINELKIAIINIISKINPKICIVQ